MWRIRAASGADPASGTVVPSAPVAWLMAVAVAAKAANCSTAADALACPAAIPASAIFCCNDAEAVDKTLAALAIWTSTSSFPAASLPTPALDAIVINDDKFPLALATTCAAPIISGVYKYPVAVASVCAAPANSPLMVDNSPVAVANAADAAIKLVKLSSMT